MRIAWEKNQLTGRDCSAIMFTTNPKLHFLFDKPIPLQAWSGSQDSRRVRLPDFKIIGT